MMKACDSELLTLIINWFLQEKNEKLHFKVVDMKKKLGYLSDFSNAVIVNERSYNDELQEARKTLINALRNSSNSIGVKQIGELELKEFHIAASRKCFVEEEAMEKAAELCSLWENNIGDPHWYSFKMITDMRGKNKVECKCEADQGSRAFPIAMVGEA